MSQILELDNIHFRYRDNIVLQGLHLKVREGEMTAIVGPNGSGKSTLLKVISGALKPLSGSIMSGNQNLVSISPRDRARFLAVVPQFPYIPETFTAWEIVLMGRTPYLGLLQAESKEDLEIVRKSMDVTGTLEFAGQPMGNLSGGERQRVLIARALAQQTPILLMDEPTANLDIAYQVTVMDTLKTLEKERGGTILIAIHDLVLAAQYCDHMALLKDGVVYVEGQPEDVLTGANVFEGYSTRVHVLNHPISGKPVVLPGPSIPI